MIRVQDDHWETIVAKLVEETIAGQITWSAQTAKDAAPPLANDGVKGPVYEAVISGKKLRVYGYEYRTYTDEDDWYMSSEVGIELVNGPTVWQLPATEKRRLLLDELERHLTGADTWGIDFLSQPKL